MAHRSLHHAALLRGLHRPRQYRLRLADDEQGHRPVADRLRLRAGIFFWGYFLFEVPSNIILHKVGARIWIARVMITWGIVSAAMAFVQGPTSFYALRFLLGVAEAGFFPGIILYLSYWFPV